MPRREGVLSTRADHANGNGGASLVPPPLKVRKMHPHDHVLAYPDTYIGGVRPLPRVEYCVLAGWRLERRDVNVAPGLLKCYDEIVSNAFDNNIRAVRRDMQPPPIEITVDGWTVTVENGGPPLSVVLDPEESVYLPELTFSTLLTSSTYDEPDRVSAGKNGVGSVVCNLFSRRFAVEVADAEVGLVFRKEWSSNMSEGSVAVVEPLAPELAAARGSRVRVTFELDVARFGLDPTVAPGFPDDALSLMRRSALDGAFCARADVIFNNEPVPRLTLAEYARRAFSPLASEPASDPVALMTWCSPRSSAAGVPELEFAAMVARGKGQISFVNGARTGEGGVHIDAIWRRLHKAIQLVWKRATLQDVKQQVALVAVASVVAPEFRGQMKEFFTGPPVAVDKLVRAHLGPLATSPVLERAFMRAVAVEQEEADAVTGGCRERAAERGAGGPHVEGLMDAELAGSARAGDCSLIIIEGASALDYAMGIVSALPGRRELNGIMEDRGVVINGYEDCERVRKSRYFDRLNGALGSAERPRYGRVILLSDQDLDGTRINALKMLIIYRFFRFVVAEGRLYYCPTPLIRAGQDNVFYDEPSYKAWAADHPRHTARYMKGLGSSMRRDVAGDVKRLHLVRMVDEGDTEDAFALMFGKSPLHVARRAEYVRDAHRRRHLHTVTLSATRPIRLYVLEDYLVHCIYNNVRSLPGIDGLKLGQRKIIWGTWKRWAPHNRPERGIQVTGKPCKVAQLAAFIAETNAYHHDERTLGNTVAHAASPDTNNHALLQPLGSFKTLRDGVGGASSARYIYTLPAHVFPFLLPRSLVPLLTFTKVENEECEPDCLLPVVPLSLVNGVRGIGTGFFSFIPPHDIHQVVGWIQARLTGAPRRLPRPFYRDFLGKVEVITHRRVRVVDGAGATDEEVEGAAMRQMVTEAAWTIIKISRDRNILDVLVTALQPGVTISAYTARLDGFVREGLIRGYSDRSVIEHTRDVTRITISGILMRNHFAAGHPLHSRAPASISTLAVHLGLRSYTSLDNFVVVGPTGALVRYPTVGDLLEGFFTHALPFYHRLAELLVTALEKDVRDLRHRRDYVRLVVDRKLDLCASERTILSILETHDIPEEVYANAKTRGLNAEAVAALQAQVDGKVIALEEQRQVTGEQLWARDLDALIAHITGGGKKGQQEDTSRPEM